MDDIQEREQFDKDTDLIIQIIHRSNEQREAEARARFEVAVEAAAASYRYHRKQVRRRFHILNQVSMALTGGFGLLTIYLCLTGGGWYSLLSVVATFATWVFSRWCNIKSRRRKGED